MPIRSAALLHDSMPDPVPGEAELELKRVREELKVTLRQLHATQQQLVQTERLRAMGALVKGMAHDFGNALAEILGHAELLQHKSREKSADRQFGECAEKIATAALQAGEIVERLREFHRPPTTMVRTSLAIDVLVRQAVDFTRPRWESESRADGVPVEIVTEFADVAPVLGCGGELRDMLTALIFNALEAMPQGGKVTIRTQLWGKRLEISITDSGAGMADEVRRRCFEPFFTTRGSRNAGLGLAMVYGVVERHSGTIEIESHRGRGTTVRLTLPIDARPAAAHPTAERRPVHPLHILVVDDQPEQGELLAQLLAHDWHKVSTASHGYEAMKIFERTHFDLVITDQAMPDINGHQIAVAVKGREPGTKVIMLTGFGPPDGHSGEASDFVDLVVAKPVNSAGLRAAIGQVMNGW